MSDSTIAILVSAGSSVALAVIAIVAFSVKDKADRQREKTRDEVARQERLDAAQAAKDERAEVRLALKNSTEASVKEVREVKTTLKDNQKEQTNLMTGIADVGKATHVLVNSQHGIALSTVYEQALRIRDLMTDPHEREAAQSKVDAAKLKLDDHEQKQAKLDNKGGVR